MSEISQAGNPYPSTLKLIREWSHDDLLGLMDFVRDVWSYPELGFTEHKGKTEDTFELHTVGWSGNEEIIAALQDNGMFWSLCWDQSRRGGHYIFKVRK